jgi:GTP-binding protein
MATRRPSYICTRCIRSITRQQTRTLSTHAIEPSTTSPPLSKAALLTLTPASLNSYKDTAPPNAGQISYAAQYFTTQSPQFLFSTAYFRAFPPSSAPEVTFLGRSNVGKSSLLNALFNRPHSKLAYVSRRPGRTKVMNVFGIGGASTGGVRTHVKPGMSLEMMRQAGEEKGKDSETRNFIGNGGLVVVDCPGYGFASRDEWGKEVVKYLQGRKQYDASIHPHELIFRLLILEQTP